MSLIIEIKELKKSYFLPKLQIEILKGIDVEVETGEFVAIMGPSGSGKSTLLNIMGCLDRPTEGTYFLEGLDISAKNDNELAELRNRKFGFVFQSFNLLPRFPAWKNVEIPLVYSGVAPKERKEKALRMLERVGLLERAEHKPNELSGGEQQRVAIARALVNSPAVIYADEPTGNLDSKSGTEIMKMFKDLHEEGVTIILVTHDRDVAGQTERTITVRDGMCQSGCR